MSAMFRLSALFAGEACGVHYTLAGGREYMRPATPPTFFMNTAMESMDKLIACAPGRMVVGHYGMKPNGCGLLARHRKQLLFWEQWMSARIEQYAAEESVERCAEGLLAEDPLLSALVYSLRRLRRGSAIFSKTASAGFWDG